MRASKVYIIILNYNGWRDSIECLESIFKLNYENYQVIVVDNASTDGSAEKIKSWAAGDLEVKADNALKYLSFPPVPKPISYTEYDTIPAASTPDKSKLILIHAGSNGGFAAGNNVGVKYALQKNDFDHLWLLNNDTVVEKDSLKELVVTAEKEENKNSGIIGSRLLYYYRPNILQGIGGKYNKWLGSSVHLGENTPDNSFNYNLDIKLDYIIGASMFVRKIFIRDVGLLNEKYFLYFEEIDWAVRAKKHGYSLKICTKSKIYHKEGATIGGSNLNLNNKSLFSDLSYLRSKLLFTRQHYPLCMITVYLSTIITIINRIKRKQSDRIPFLLKVLANPSKMVVQLK